MSASYSKSVNVGFSISLCENYLTNRCSFKAVHSGLPFFHFSFSTACEESIIMSRHRGNYLGC